MHKHLKQQIATINKTFENYDQETAEKLIQNCVYTLYSGGRIIASALGKNVPVCEKFIGTLNSLGIDSHFLNTNSATHGDLGLIKPGDLVIMLSKGGMTNETVYLAQLLKDRGTTNWLLTCNKRGEAHKYIKNIMVLPIDQEGDPWNIIPNSSTLVFLIFLQALAMELITRLNIPLSVFKANHPGGGIGKALKSTKR